MENNILSALNYLLSFSLVFSLQLIVILLLRKPVSHFFGVVATYWLWLLPLIWLPFFIVDWSFVTFDFSIFQAEVVTASSVPNSNLESNYILPLIQFFEFDVDINQLFNSRELSSTKNNFGLMLFGIWGLGFSFFLFKLLFQMRQFSKLIKRLAKPLDIEMFKEYLLKANFKIDTKLFSLDGINSPALYGFFSPVLLLPENFLQKYSVKQRQLILVHEGVHLRRKDNAWNMLVAVLRIIFWFNPLVHFAHRYYSLDQEVSCDTQALENGDPAMETCYALTLLESVNTRVFQQNPKITAWGSLAELKERVAVISNFRSRPTNLKLTLGVFFILVLFGGVLTACTNNQHEKILKIPESSAQVSEGIENSLSELSIYIEKENYFSAMDILDEIMKKHEINELNRVEEFKMWNAYTTLFFNQEEYRKAIEYSNEMLNYKDVISQREYESSLILIASLYSSVGEYRKGIDLYLEYYSETKSPIESLYIAVSGMYMELEEYEEGLEFLLQHMETLENIGQEIPYRMYQFELFFYRGLEDKEKTLERLNVLVDKFQIESDIEKLKELEIAFKDDIL